VVRAYAANTNQGLVRNYNEDRVSIITNLLPPKGRTDIKPEQWPKCSYFGIYDGHGGSLCADFLRDNLHTYVIMEPCFPENPQEAIIRGFAKAEAAFISKVYDPVSNTLRDKSGSCAIVCLIVQETCYVANVGDSRAVLSSDSGRKMYPLSNDHKPGDEKETQRIKDGGGEIYYRTATNQIIMYDQEKMNKYQQLNLAGPLRVLPGRLSVARTFGDPEAKIKALNGNPNVVIHNPEIKSFKIKREHDFIVLGCDGIFDKMSN
jgi:protein phosphatase 2C family protein 2/3